MKEERKIKMKNTKKLNNRGFSLVELIIVIAIMAVLIGVLSPAYLRYVEKSRKSADVQGIDAVMSAMETAAVDSSLNLEDGTEMVVTIGKESMSIECEKNSNAKTDLKETLGVEYRLKSGDWKEIKITGKVDSGRVTFTCKPDYKTGIDDAQRLTGFAPDMAAKLSLFDASGNPKDKNE